MPPTPNALPVNDVPPSLVFEGRQSFNKAVIISLGPQQPDVQYSGLGNKRAI